METLQITLFGQVKVVHPNESAPLKLTRGMQALLAYLLLHQHLVPRDVLMDVFWVDHAPDRARSSLTTAIWRLRQLLEPDDVRPGTYLITSNTGEVGFNWESQHWLDSAAFERSIHPLLRKPLPALGEEDIQQIEGVLAHYRGELLEGVYDDWALRERERFRTLHLNCLTRLMEFHAGRKNFEQSIAFGQEILRRDPLREEIHRGADAHLPGERAAHPRHPSIRAVSRYPGPGVGRAPAGGNATTLRADRRCIASKRC